MKAPAFAGVDWGTTHLRAWLLTDQGEALAERRSDQGLLAVQDGGFAGVLEEHLAVMGAAPSLPVVMCGMVGSRQGWVEAPYVGVPVLIADICDTAIAAPLASRPAWILPGVAQTRPDAPDVMRGEETQLAGLIDTIGESAIICMPGTHSKWVRISGRRIDGLMTFMTGELYSVLSKQSILRHAVGGEFAEPAHPSTFLDWLDESLASPGDASSRLFRIRASALLLDMKPADAAAALSGLLIGCEIAAALTAHPAARESVHLIASGALTALYALALERAGCVVTTVDAESAARTGLARAARRLLRGRA